MVDSNFFNDFNRNRRVFNRNVGDKTIIIKGKKYYNKPVGPVIHILGLYNSGTNVVALTLKTCCSGASITMNGPFWKHLLPSQPMFQVYPDFTYIVLIRDPFSWIFSMRKNHYELSCGPKISDNCTLHDPNWPTLEFENIAAVWLRYITEYAALTKKYPDIVHVIRYEDLLNSSNSVISEALLGSPILFCVECTLYRGVSRPWYTFKKLCMLGFI